MFGTNYSIVATNKRNEKLEEFIRGIQFDKVNSNHINKPTDIISKLLNNDSEKELANKILQFSSLKLSQIDISDINDLFFLFMIKAKYNTESVHVIENKLIHKFIVEFNYILNNFNSRRVKIFIQRHKFFLPVFFEGYNDFEIVKRMILFNKKTCNIINKLKNNLSDGKYDFVESVNYFELKNNIISRLYTEFILKEYSNEISELIKDQKDVIDVLTDKTVINKTSISSIITNQMQELKDKFYPGKIHKSTGISQEDGLEMSKHIYSMFLNTPYEYLFKSIDSAFKFRKININGASSMLYDVFIEVYNGHPHYPFYTKKYWIQLQDKKNGITADSWNKFKRRRIKNISPEIFLDK